MTFGCATHAVWVGAVVFHEMCLNVFDVCSVRSPVIGMNSFEVIELVLSVQMGINLSRVVIIELFNYNLEVMDVDELDDVDERYDE